MGWVREVEGEKMSVMRMFFWEFVDHEDTKASWLSFILSTFVSTTSNKESVEHQAAQLLFLLLGPADDDLFLLPPSFRDLNYFRQNLFSRLQASPTMLTMQEQVPVTYTEAKEMFSDLGKGLRLLLRSPNITNTSLASIMIALFDNMHWLVDNQAACLLFSCEAVVKLFLASLLRRKDGIVKVSHMLVAMTTVCGRLSNDLNQGLFKILEWSFTVLEKGQRKKMIGEFWKEMGERLEEGEIVEDMLVQLGVLVGGRAYTMMGQGTDSDRKGLGQADEEAEE